MSVEIVGHATLEQAAEIREAATLFFGDFADRYVAVVNVRRRLGLPGFTGGSISGRPDTGYMLWINPGMPLEVYRVITVHEMTHMLMSVYYGGKDLANLTDSDPDYVWPHPSELIYHRFPEWLLREWSHNEYWRVEGLPKLIRIALLDPRRLYDKSADAWAAFEQLWSDTTDESVPELPAFPLPSPALPSPSPSEPPPSPSGKAQVERWRALVHATAQAARATGLPTPTDAQLLAQIEQESGGDPDAESPVHAHGLGQIMGQEDPRFGDRPARRWLTVPTINVAWMVYMMSDALWRSKRRGDARPWQHALLEYYTGDLDGWDRAFGGASGRDYVRLVSARVSLYTRLPSGLGG